MVQSRWDWAVAGNQTTRWRLASPYESRRPTFAFLWRGLMGQMQRRNKARKAPKPHSLLRAGGPLRPYKTTQVVPHSPHASVRASRRVNANTTAVNSHRCFSRRSKQLSKRHPQAQIGCKKKDQWTWQWPREFRPFYFRFFFALLLPRCFTCVIVCRSALFPKAARA
jgi:hypothetical protein